MKKAQENEFDFEKGMKRLEEIVSLFDAGGLTLDQMEKNFLEGMDLVQRCSKRLNQVETRITLLVKENDTDPPLESGEEE
ncbi:MAG: exodeoxyribonuclease VII small subunit [Candidatus Omnitrophota bacterium]|jgi:exodeoxyribonuclease VII small subunit|nr:MAG: exodeoxyribonuclease VII small subunit [Candidatus Omnitrophota bacterium]